MITLTADCNDTLVYISRELGALKAKAPAVLARAINDTAKSSRTLLGDKARETYLEKTGAFKKAMDIDKASSAHPIAVIGSTGAAQNVADFKVSPARPNRTAKAYRGKVLKLNTLKLLTKNANKAFVAQMNNGRWLVVARKRKERYPIDALFSPSIPQMLGSEQRVYGIVEPDISSLLMVNIQAQIDKTIKGAGT